MTDRHVHREFRGDLVCTGCLAVLYVVPTAYGARATCDCPDIRWTMIRPTPEGTAGEWVAEKR